MRKTWEMEELYDLLKFHGILMPDQIERYNEAKNKAWKEEAEAQKLKDEAEAKEKAERIILEYYPKAEAILEGRKQANLWGCAMVTFFMVAIPFVTHGGTPAGLPWYLLAVMCAIAANNVQVKNFDLRAAKKAKELVKRRELERSP